MMLTAEAMAQRLSADARLSADGLEAWKQLSTAVDALGRAP
jgi:hypothetical protein